MSPWRQSRIYHFTHGRQARTTIAIYYVHYYHAHHLRGPCATMSSDCVVIKPLDQVLNDKSNVESRCGAFSRRILKVLGCIVLSVQWMDVSTVSVSNQGSVILLMRTLMKIYLNVPGYKLISHPNNPENVKQIAVLQGRCLWLPSVPRWIRVIVVGSLGLLCRPNMHVGSNVDMKRMVLEFHGDKAPLTWQYFYYLSAAQAASLHTLQPRCSTLPTVLAGSRCPGCSLSV